MPDPAHGSGLFVYAVVTPESPVPDRLTGLDGAPVELVAGGRVAAAVGRLALERAPSRRADLLAYNNVLEALSAAGPVVPVRFGSVLPDARAVVEELLLPQDEAFDGMLEQLRGRHQFAVRATYLEDVVLKELVAADPEIRRLRARTRELPEEASYADRVRLGELVARGLEERSVADAELLLAEMVPHVAGHVVRADPGADQVLDVALLVDDERADDFVERLEGLAEAVHERIRMRLVGPVAPYDFVASA